MSVWRDGFADLLVLLVTLGPMIRLLGSRNYDAAPPVMLADVRSVCDSVYLFYLFHLLVYYGTIGSCAIWLVFQDSPRVAGVGYV